MLSSFWGRVFYIRKIILLALTTKTSATHMILGILIFPHYGMLGFPGTESITNPKP